MNFKGGHIAALVAIGLLILFAAGGAKLKVVAGAFGDAEGGALDGEVADADTAPESFTAWYCPPRAGSGHFTRRYNSSMPSSGRGGDWQCPL